MSAERIAELEAALRDAVYVARACKAFVDEQGNRYFGGERPNWKSAALAVSDEIDSKPDDWAALLGMPAEGVDPIGGARYG
jgi:hypothetical protein